MAFEAFLTESQKRPKARRRLITTLSLIAHGGLAMAAVVYSFWHVDELSPPTVTVTFLTAAPPPPPPPPAAKKTAKVKPVTPKEIVQPKPNEIVQPKKKEEPEEDDDNGVVGGVVGGVAGGVSTLHAAQAPQAVVEAPPRFVPPSIAGQQLLTNPVTDPQYRVVMPGALASSTMRLWAMVKVCVSKQGTVSSATLVKSMDPSVDPLLIKKIQTYRYKPMAVDGNPITFCYNLRYEHVTR